MNLLWSRGLALKARMSVDLVMESVLSALWDLVAFPPARHFVLDDPGGREPVEWTRLV